MKLDRNINPNGMGKYALVKTRSSSRIGNLWIRLWLWMLPYIGIKIDRGVVGSDDEFFPIKLKDKYAADALFAYADAAESDGMVEWSREVLELAKRAGHNHPKCKRPD